MVPYLFKKKEHDMSELNFKPAAGGGFAGDKTVSVPALDASTATATSATRESAQARQQRRRLNVLRYTIDPGFRLFRVF